MFYDSHTQRIEILDFERGRSYYLSGGQWRLGGTVEMGTPPADFYERCVTFDGENGGLLLAGLLGDRIAVLRCRSGVWSGIASDLSRYAIHASFVHDQKRSRTLLVYEGPDPDRGWDIYEIRHDTMYRLPCPKIGAERRNGSVVGYHPEYDGILIYGAYVSSFLGLRRPRPETWIARYIEEGNRFEWERLD